MPTQLGNKGVIMKRWAFAMFIGLPFLAAADLFAGEVMLSWTANREADLSGYHLYYGKSSRRYGSPIKLGKTTTYTVTKLDTGDSYYFALTAVDTAGNESGYSGEIKAVAKASPSSPSAAEPAQTAASAVPKVTGKVKLHLRWTAYANRSKAVPVKIYDGSKLLAKTKVNQRKNGGRWNSLGTYTFKKGARVVIVANGTGTACADALRLTRSNGNKIFLDNGQAGTSQTGTWARSLGAKPYGGHSVYANRDATYTFKTRY